MPNALRAGFLAIAAVFGLGAFAASAQTLAAVKARDTLNCGVSQGLAGFSDRNAQGVWAGFDVDLRKAVPAAVLGDPAKVT